MKILFLSLSQSLSQSLRGLNNLFPLDHDEWSIIGIWEAMDGHFGNKKHISHYITVAAPQH